jgi:hypothetical protein
VLTYEDFVELARVCVKMSGIATNPRVASELMQSAREFQRRAAALNAGSLPDIGEDRLERADNRSGMSPAVADLPDAWRKEHSL